jgi:DNA-binding NtrC family response regulator
VDKLKSIRILFIRDSAKETQRIVDELRRGHFDPTYSLVDTIPAVQSALDAGGWDLVIADFSLEHGSGLDALALMQKQGIDLPCIVIAQSGDEECACRALKAGAHDFLGFDQLTRLIPIIEREMRQADVRRKLYALPIERAADTVRTTDTKQLIGLIGHDFNNQLAIILTAAAFVLDNMDQSNPLRQEIEQILKAGRQANDLNQQLLRLSQPEDHGSQQSQLDERHQAPAGTYQKNCVLVVEDDDSVRKLVCRILSTNGYEVLSAQNSNEALAMCQRTNKTINLLLTDVIMPGLSGKVLADQLTQNHPGLKVLFMSGYSDEAVSWRNNMAPNTSFIQKPFGNFELLNCVREVLQEDTFGS